jgi:hypothetical protein
LTAGARPPAVFVARFTVLNRAKKEV